jgi:hypothetical protein
MSTPLRIGIAGLGTVGAGVVKLLETNAELITRRAGRPIVVTAVSARDRHRERGIDLSAFAWEDDATTLAARGDVDVVVELVGGAQAAQYEGGEGGDQGRQDSRRDLAGRACTGGQEGHRCPLDAEVRQGATAGERQARQKGPMRLVIRTIGIARATAKVTLAKLACNMDRLVFHARRSAMG